VVVATAGSEAEVAVAVKVMAAAALGRVVDVDGGRRLESRREAVFAVFWHRSLGADTLGRFQRLRWCRRRKRPRRDQPAAACGRASCRLGRRRHWQRLWWLCDHGGGVQAAAVMPAKATCLAIEQGRRGCIKWRSNKRQPRRRRRGGPGRRGSSRRCCRFGG
jgi:hypothetical protein